MKKIKNIIKNWYYHEDLTKFYQFNIPSNHSILNIYYGGHDYFKSSFSSSRYASIDLLKYQSLPNRTFDSLIMSDTLSLTDDIQKLFHELKTCVTPESRILINYHNFIWKPALSIAELFHMKEPQKRNNWLDTGDIINFLELEGYQMIKTGKRFLLPVYIPILSRLINKYLAQIPFINALCFTNVLIARLQTNTRQQKTVSIIVPARNEEGNINNIVRRIPKFGTHQEIIFIEGHSKDNTWKEILRVSKLYPHMNIKALKQKGIGKADAVQMGFSEATGDIFMICDADLSVAPEDLPKFYNALVSGKGEYINGCRLVYPVEKEAMQFLNMLGNHFFLSHYPGF